MFTGDSITDAGRKRPVGEDAKDWLGKGYVCRIASILEAWQPGHGCRIQNTGIAGNTVRELQERWQEDVLDLKPDWLSLMIGINDCARGFGRPQIEEDRVSPELYRDSLERLLATIRPSLKGLVLLTPFYIDSSFQDPLRLELNLYAKHLKDLATRYDAVLVDTQAAFDRVLKQLHSSRLSQDRVHPNECGHLLLARAWLDAVGFEWHG